MELRILVLPGDGIGPEVTAEAVGVLARVADLFGHSLRTVDGLIGGAAIEAAGSPLPGDTLRAAVEADAVLLGAVGAPKFDALPPDRRPERGLLELRQALGTFANLRPSRAWPALLEPATVVTTPVPRTTLRILWLPMSATKRLPMPSRATPSAMSNCAAAPVPSAKPWIPEPASVVTTPVEMTTWRIAKLSETKRWSAPSPVIPIGK